MMNPAIYFQSVQGVSASESGVRNLPLILSMSLFFYLTLHLFLTAHNSSFYRHLGWCSYCNWPLRSVLDPWGSHHLHRWRAPLHSGRWISIFSLDRLPSSCRHRTWYLLPDPGYGWTSTCKRCRCGYRDGNTYV